MCGRPPTDQRSAFVQVAREFESVCPALKVDSFYGGVSIGAQVGADGNGTARLYNVRLPGP